VIPVVFVATTTTTTTTKQSSKRIHIMGQLYEKVLINVF